MLSIQSKIFIPSNKKFSKWSISQKAFALFIILSLIMSILIGFIDNSNSNSIIKNLIYVLLLLVFICYIISITGPFHEYEPLYGTFTNSFIINEEGVIINNTFYEFHDFELFDISIKSFYGSKTGNTKFGPKYRQGIDNKIYFITTGMIFHEYYYISTEQQFETLKQIIDKAIIEEKIPFRNRYLYLISKNAKDTLEYKDFIKKLRNEKRINTK